MQEVEEAEFCLGVPFPQALREWFSLVGRRLRPVQDYLSRLDELTSEQDRLIVWRENQDSWILHRPLGAGDDPVCLLEGLEGEKLWWPLDEPLVGMCFSEALAGSWGLEVQTKGLDWG